MTNVIAENCNYNATVLLLMTQNVNNDNTTFTCVKNAGHEDHRFLADRTNGRAIATLLRLSSSSCL